MTTLRKFVLCTLLLIASVAAQSAITLSDPIPVNPLLKVGKLDNGLTYYIQQNSKPAKHAELRLVVKAGSILEDDDQQGLAHFTEHMAFNGSRHFKKHELISYLQSLGIKFGADLNAYTSFDETVYILPLPTDKKENLEKGMLVLEDWAQGLTMNDADIDAERNIILEEARLGRGASDRMGRKLYPSLFNGSRYADRLPIGQEDIIRNFKHDVIKRFYADWYRPDLMAVFVVGDIDPKQTEQMIKEHFGYLKNPVPERPRFYPSIPARAESSSLVITDKEATGNTLMIQFPAKPNEKEVTIADYRKSLIRDLGTAILNQRLQELTQQASPPFLSGSSSYAPLVKGVESFSSTANVGRAGVASATNALIQENERVRQFGFSPDELNRAKMNRQRFMESAYNERNKSESASLVAEYIRHFLVNEPIPGIVNEFNYAKELLPSITLDEINVFAKNAIPDNAALLAVYLGSNNEGETIPTKSQLLDWVSAAEKAPVVANNDTNLPTNIMTQPPKAGSIKSESFNKLLGITTLTLSNGVKVILKPTNFKSDQILVGANRFGGQSLFGEDDMYNARYADAVVDQMGLANFTPTELQKILAGKSIAFRSTSGSSIENLSGYAASSDIETLLQTIYLRFDKPRVDENLYAAFINQMQDASKNSLAKPESVLSNTLITTLYANHPRVLLTPKPEDFTHMSLDRVTSIYRSRFSSAKGFTFVFVGSFDVNKIKPLIATYLASLPTTEIVTSFNDLNIRPVTGIVKKEVHSGSEDKSRVTLVFTGKTIYSKEENMRFNALIEIMNLRFTDVLREKLRLIYNGGMSGAIERIPYQNYRLSIGLPCQPDHVEQVIAATFSEINKMKDAGPTEEELNKVKANWHKTNNIALSTNEHWLNRLQDATLYHTNAADLLTIDKRIDAVTAAEVQEAAKRYLDTENYVQVVLYPEKRTDNVTK